jgi:hypothetical protein
MTHRRFLSDGQAGCPATALAAIGIAMSENGIGFEARSELAFKLANLNHQIMGGRLGHQLDERRSQMFL